MKKIKAVCQDGFKKVYSLLAKTPLRKVPGMWDISDIIIRNIWGKTNTIEIEGSKMYINLRDPSPSMRKTFQAYVLRQIHEETTTALFKKMVKPQDTVLDLGANIGYFTLLAARLVGKSGKVFSFEPEPTNFNYLKKNIEINGYGNVTAENKAVSNTNGKTKLFICSYDSGHHTINQYDGIEAYSRGKPSEKNFIEIDTVILDEFLKDKTEKVNIVKIDIEGAETLAISGMRSILKNNAKIKVFLEFFPILIEKMGHSSAKLIESLLEDFKFNIYVIGHDYSMQGYDMEFLKIQSYDQLLGLLKDKYDHVNLYLTRETLSNSRS